MAKGSQQNPSDKAQAASKLADLKSRFLFLIGALIVFRAGTYIPVPGVDPIALAAFFEQQGGTLLGMVNLFSGGALSRFGIFCHGHHAVHFVVNYYADGQSHRAQLAAAA